ncbi:hypothetical protein N0V85_008981 [Neurospora sp. IMI 360204]|nr:hypothetical protein N0V85_008981 [Neurospora sp. IMI 360204]
MPDHPTSKEEGEERVRNWLRAEKEDEDNTVGAMKSDSDSEERHQEGEAVTDGEKQNDEKTAVPRNMAEKTTRKVTLHDRLIAAGLDPDADLSIVAAMKWIQDHPELYPRVHPKPHPTLSASGIHEPAADKAMKNESHTVKLHQEGDTVLDGGKRMWEKMPKLVSSTRTKSVHTTTTTNVERRVSLSDRLEARGLQSVHELPAVHALKLNQAHRESSPLADQKTAHSTPSDGIVIQELAKNAMKNDCDTADKRQQQGEAITHGRKQVWENMEKLFSGNMLPSLQTPTSMAPVALTPRIAPVAPMGSITATQHSIAKEEEERRARFREKVMARDLQSGEELSVVTALKRIHAHPELYPRAHQHKCHPSIGCVASESGTQKTANKDDDVNNDSDIHETTDLTINIEIDNDMEQHYQKLVRKLSRMGLRRVHEKAVGDKSAGSMSMSDSAK